MSITYDPNGDLNPADMQYQIVAEEVDWLKVAKSICLDGWTAVKTLTLDKPEDPKCY